MADQRQPVAFAGISGSLLGEATCLADVDPLIKQFMAQIRERHFEAAARFLFKNLIPYPLYFKFGAYSKCSLVSGQVLCESLYPLVIHRVAGIRPKKRFELKAAGIS